MPRTLLSLALAAAVVAPAALAADGADLTVYRSDSAALFSAGADGAVNDGYAVVHEQRHLQLTAGTHDMVIGNLPDYLDPEAVALSFGSNAQVLSQRLLLPHGQNGTLTGHIGKQVTVLGASGKPLAQGTLARVGADGSLIIGGDVYGPTVVRDYAAVKLTGGEVGGGARLQLRVDASRGGATDAVLTYPTSGIGWRAAYTATLKPGNACRMQLKSQASIANRSGRDWQDADIKLVAGEPNFAKPSAPRPVMMRAAAADKAESYAAAQSTLGDYRSYTLPGAVDLPAGSVTLTPLYDARSVDCTRTWLFDNGNSWTPPQPMTADNGSGEASGPVASTLAFRAFDSLPAGYLRVLTMDADGNAEFLGEGRVADTPKGQDVDFTLGTAFDLRGTRERTAFNVDQAARQMDEAFRITLSNAGDSARTVTVREHPNRWRNWTLTSSSTKPSKQTTDTLEFRVDVPANGSATLDYAVQYTWTAADEQ
jgi:hypothetical protein